MIPVALMLASLQQEAIVLLRVRGEGGGGLRVWTQEEGHVALSLWIKPLTSLRLCVANAED